MLLVAGACFFTQSASFDKCALQPNECTSGQVFRSPSWLATNDINLSNQCSKQDKIRKLRSLGRCNGNADRYICTSDKTACRFQAVFSPLTTDCDLVHDNLSSNEFTNAHFGFCNGRGGRSDFCAWSFRECGGNTSMYEWEIADPFFANQNPDCHCDDVKTGACIDKNENIMYCAVAPEVCIEDEGFTYLKVLDLKSQLNMTCNLCDTLSAEYLAGDDKDSGEDGGSSVTQSDDGSASSGTLDTKSTGGVEGKNDDTSGSKTAGIIIGSIIGFSVVAAGVVYSYRVRREKTEIEIENAGNIPSVS